MPGLNLIGFLIPPVLPVFWREDLVPATVVLRTSFFTPAVDVPVFLNGVGSIPCHGDLVPPDVFFGRFLGSFLVVFFLAISLK